MSFDVPTWWPTILLVAASFRVWHLLAHDTIMEGARRRVLRISETWQKEGDDPGDDYRLEWGVFLNCPYCSGFWVSLVMYGFWLWQPTATLVFCTPFALSAGVIALSKVLTQES